MKKPQLHTITPDISKELHEIATKLGAIPRTRKKKNSKDLELIYPQYSISGARLLERDPKMTMKDGTVINKKSTYLITGDQPEMVSWKYHESQLRTHFLAKGYEGVLEYSTSVKEQYKQWQEIINLEAEKAIKAKEDKETSSKEESTEKETDIKE